MCREQVENVFPATRRICREEYPTVEGIQELNQPPCRFFIPRLDADCRCQACRQVQRANTVIDVAMYKVPPFSMDSEAFRNRFQKTCLN